MIVIIILHYHYLSLQWLYLYIVVFKFFCHLSAVRVRAQMSPTTLLRIARILRAVRVLRPSAAQRIPATKTVQCSKQEWKFVMLIYSMKEDDYLLVSSYSRFKEEAKKVHNLELQQKVQSKSASNSSMIKILERETEKLWSQKVTVLMWMAQLQLVVFIAWYCHCCFFHAVHFTFSKEF